MQLTFGMFLDGASWSDKSASPGEIKMGPLQFLAWLESSLGLGGVSVSAPERINEYMQRIRHAAPAWCKSSFELDSWSTAKFISYYVLQVYAFVNPMHMEHQHLPLPE